MVLVDFKKTGGYSDFSVFFGGFFMSFGHPALEFF